MACYEAQYEKAINVSTECSFINTSNTAADFKIGGKHSLAVACFQKAEQRLERLHMTRPQTKVTVRVSEGSEDGPDISFSCRRYFARGWVRFSSFDGQFCECHVFTERRPLCP